MTSAPQTPADPPGTNVRGGASGASWRLLLPSPAPKRTVIVGSASTADLRALTDAGGSVSMLLGGSRRGRWRRRRVTVGTDRRPATDGDGAADAVVVLGARGLRALRHPAVVRDLRRVCADETVVYVQRRRRDAGSEVAALGRPIRREMRIGITDGDLRWAAPGADAAAVGAARKLGATRGGGVRARVERMRDALRGRLFPDPDVAELRATEDLGDPPRYLREVAAGSAVELDGRRWAMAIPGLYASNKAVFLLFSESDDDPDLVVKVARTRSQNERLENEARALRALASTRWIERGSAPRERFFGIHSGTAILGETVLTGEPFRSRTAGEPGCSIAAEVVDRLIALGEETATPGSPPELRVWLDGLFERYRRLYRPDPRDAAFLRSQIDAIGTADAIPRVFQHGDPGTWNILVSDDGTIGFLDWEAADPDGVPLWDLFYFLRSFAVTVSRAHGVRDAMSGIRRQLFAASDLADVVADVTNRGRERVGMPTSLVEPLFLTCWMHRAVKQAARLPRSRLRSGHYHRLLTTAIEQRGAPGLRRLFDDA